tara:strand:+ start:1290 stop:1937 length:648 start_codon:yes stop_codon:yes gene_type:complete
MEHYKRLWVFGDSFSTPWSQTKGEHKRYWVQKNPIHFEQILLQELSVEASTNLAVSGYSNSDIIETIGKNIKDIDESDYVLIGWSDITRYRTTVLNKNQWTTVSINNIRPHTPDSPKYFHEECFSRDHQIVVEELESWICILNRALPKNTLHWTPFQDQVVHHKMDLFTPNFKLKRIFEEGEVNDKHITEEAHKDVANWMIDIFNNGKPSNINLI